MRDSGHNELVEESCRYERKGGSSGKAERLQGWSPDIAEIFVTP